MDRGDYALFFSHRILVKIMSCISIYDHNDYDCDEFCFSILRPEESRNRESGGGRNLMRKIVIACVHCYSGANAIDI